MLFISVYCTYSAGLGLIQASYYTVNVKYQMSKNIYRRRAVCREFDSKALAAEEMLDHVVCSSEQFSF